MHHTTGDTHIGGRGRERGAVLPMAAAGIVLAVVAAALSIDLGALALKRRDLQKIADIAAMDTSYVLDEIVTADQWPIKVGQLTPPSELAMARAHESLARNGMDPDEANKLVVELGEYVRDAEPEFTPCHDVLTILAACEANAVRVVLADEAPKYFDMSSGPGRVTEVDAIAVMQTIEQHSGDSGGTLAPGSDDSNKTALSVGSFLARLQHDSLPVPPMLEQFVDAPAGSLSADVISYNGMADTTVTLEDLAAQLTAGDVSQLLTTQVTYDDWLTAMAAALQHRGSTAQYEAQAVYEETAADILTIKGSVGAGPGSFDVDRTFSVADIVTAQLGGDDAAAETGINTLDLLMASGMAINGANAVYLDLTSGQLPEPIRSQVDDHIATFAATMSVIELPKIAVGGVGIQAESAQVRIDLDVTLADEFRLTKAQLEDPAGTLAGVVTDTTGAPIPNATVKVEGSGVCAQTNADGRYAITGVLAGTVLVTAGSPDFSPVTLSSTVGVDATTTLGFSLPPSAVSLPPLGCLSEAQATVAGTVSDATSGAPVADATVTLEGTGVCVAANENGDYAIAHSIAGGVSVVATAPGYANASVPASLSTSGTKTVPLSLVPDGGPSVPLPEPACVEPSLLDNGTVLATSPIRFPAAFQIAHATGTVGHIDCATGGERVLVDVETGALDMQIGEDETADDGAIIDLRAVDTLVSDALVGLVESAVDTTGVDLDSEDYGHPFLPSDAPDPDWYPSAHTFSAADPTVLGNLLAEPVSPLLELVDGAGLPAEAAALTPEELAANADALKQQIAGALSSVVALGDWLGGGLGVTPAGADVTTHDLNCVTEGSSTWVPTTTSTTDVVTSRVPTLVE